VPYFRWGIVAAIFALVVSVGLGLITGVSAFHIFIRALFFTAVFFGLGFGVRFLINSIFPELLLINEESENQEIFGQPGSRVNITLDTAGEYAVPEFYKTADDSDEVGNIEDLVSGVFKPSQESIDRKREEGYNNTEGVQSFQNLDPFQDASVFGKAPAEKPAFTPSFGDDSEGLGGLPDLDAMSTAFSSGFGGGSSFGGSSGSASFEEVEPAQTRNTGNKPQPLEGDFSPKELAKGISTVLSKEK